MLPDFLGIGAQKAGTTWLWDNLRHHPDLWLPPLKEIHFFDRGIHHPSPLRPGFYDERWFRHLRRRAAERWRARSLAGLSWDLSYFFRRRDRGWYERVFAPGPGQLAGDITPAYGILPPDEVARVVGWMPRAKVILLLRDPIDRAWSGARMAARLRGLDLEDGERLARYFDAQRTGRGDYLRMLASWEAHVPPERFLVGFFEDLVAEPAAFLGRVHRFLGVRTGPDVVPASVGARRNEGEEAPLPPAAARHLARRYERDLEVLAERFGGWPARWLARARALLAGETAAPVGARAAEEEGGGEGAAREGLRGSAAEGAARA